MSIDAINNKLDDLKHTLMSLTHLSRMLLNSQSQAHIAHYLSTSRGLDPLRLLKYGWKVFSQNDEDGIIEEIFRRIGTKSKKFLEFGVESGIECNSLYLLNKGWRGVWIEASAKHVASICRSHSDWISDGSLRVVQSMIDRDNIEALIHENDIDDIDMLSIDIDGNDYHVWDAINIAKPRLIVIEYTAVMGSMIDWIATYDPQRVYDGSNYHGASLAAYVKLGRQKGYSLVGCNLSGCNAFFVRDDLLKTTSGLNLFCSPYTAQNHFEEFRHPFIKFLAAKRISPRKGSSHDTMNGIKNASDD